jgi:23S rRNA (cytidine1920-2'-O)/16S rRNA (cytidine1409-2'-O)-methyltransferase
MTKRLDVLVSEILDVSRDYAKQLIVSGKCTVAGKIENKPGAKFALDASITIEAEPLPYVSRGGLKLARAIEVFELDLQGLLCMDIGAATGGFTDCMLQNGAKQVLALENGKGQLHPKLAANPQVISWEETDIRAINPAKMPFAPQFIAADLSFISITLALPTIAQILVNGGKIVILIKPQFEVGPGKVDKKGVIKDPKDRKTAINSVCAKLEELGMAVLGLEESPIKGKNGNTEYLLLARNIGAHTMRPQ